MPPVDLPFLIITPHDRGRSKRYIQAINANTASIRHRRLTASTRTTHGSALRTGSTAVARSPHTPRHGQWFASEKLLYTTLDPFLRLSIELGSYERDLLHEWLTHGGQPNSTPPRSPHVFDANLFIAHHLLHANDMYILTHLAMSEWIACRRRGRGPSELFYRRRGQAYRYTQNLMTTGSLLNQVAALFPLVPMELLVRDSDTAHTTHLQALHRLIDNAGGFQDVQVLMTGSGPKLGLPFISPLFVLAELHITGEQSFLETLDRFRETLRLIACHPRPSTHPRSLADNTLLLRLRQYVISLIDNYLSPSSSATTIGSSISSPRHYQRKAGALAFIFLLAATSTMYNLSPTVATELLVCLARTLFATIAAFDSRDKAFPSVFEGKPCSRLWLFWSIRAEVLHPVPTARSTTAPSTLGGENEAEGSLARGLVDCLGVLPYIGVVETVELAKGLADASLGDLGQDDNADGGNTDGRVEWKSLQWTIDGLISMARASWISAHDLRWASREIR
jgi:hypothetical protein